MEWNKHYSFWERGWETDREGKRGIGFFAETEWTSGRVTICKKKEGRLASQLILLRPPQRESSYYPRYWGKYSFGCYCLSLPCVALSVWYSPLSLCGPGLRPLVSYLKLLPSSVWMSTVCWPDSIPNSPRWTMFSVYITGERRESHGIWTSASVGLPIEWRSQAFRILGQVQGWRYRYTDICISGLPHIWEPQWVKTWNPPIKCEIPKASWCGHRPLGLVFCTGEESIQGPSIWQLKAADSPLFVAALPTQVEHTGSRAFAVSGSQVLEKPNTVVAASLWGSPTSTSDFLGLQLPSQAGILTVLQNKKQDKGKNS